MIASSSVFYDRTSLELLCMRILRLRQLRGIPGMDIETFSLHKIQWIEHSFILFQQILQPLFHRKYLPNQRSKILKSLPFPSKLIVNLTFGNRNAIGQKKCSLKSFIPRLALDIDARESLPSRVCLTHSAGLSASPIDKSDWLTDLDPSSRCFGPPMADEMLGIAPGSKVLFKL